MANENAKIDVRLNTEDFQRQLDELNKILQNGIQKMGEESSMSFNDVLSKVVNVAGAFTALDTAILKVVNIDKQIKDLGQTAATGFGAMLSSISTINPVLGGAAIAFGGLAGAAVFMAEKYGIVGEGAARLHSEIQTLADKLRDLVESFDQSETALNNRIGSLETNAELAKRLGFSRYEIWTNAA